jgi:hypothetical protein
MDTRTINGQIEDLHIAGGIVYVNGHVEDLHMNGGVIYNYGRVDDLHQNGGIHYDKGKQHAQASIIYCDRVVYRDRVVEKEVVKWKYRDREKIVYRNDDATENHLRDLLEAAMEVNRRQAARIKEMERIISKHREAEIEDPWDIEPTKADCKKLLKQFNIFTEL